MKILIFNWRDIENPAGGGAEILTHEMAKRWVKMGHEVTQFSSLFKGAMEIEKIDGVRFIRKGNSDARHLFESVHFMAFRYYKKHFKGKFDIVVDEIHGLPFFTPFYVKEKKVALICEVADKIWDTNFPYPFNILGKAIEKNYFRYYKNIPFLTISPSTKNDLQKFGVNSDNITVLPMGINLPKKLPSCKKEKNLTLVFVGRLTKAKGAEDAIKACRILKKNFANLKLWIIGRGKDKYEKKLKNMVNKLELGANVVFMSFVSQEKKFELIARSHVLVAPSIKEGFGLTIPEAGIVSTPAVAYNVGGLRDIIVDGENGLLIKPEVKEIAKSIQKLIIDQNLYKRIQQGALKYAKSLSWDNAAKVALSTFTS